MSLFGNLNASQPSKPGGLFGSLGGAPQPQQPAQTGGLFGSLGAAASQPQQSSGLFGNSTQQTTQAGGGGLFGAKPTQAPQTGGLFGGTATAAPQAGSLFGNTTTQAPQAGGSFGNTNANPTQAGGSLFGGQNASTQAAQPQQQNPSLGMSLGQAQPDSTSYFDSILEKSRKRALGDRGDEDIPQLQLGLGDIRQRMKRFAPNKSDNAVDGKAHYLLAASGVDPGAAIRDLNMLNATTGRTERPQPYEAADTDVDGYLNNLDTQTTLSMISDGLARSIRDFDTFLEDNVNMEWDAQRKRIYQHFGIKQRSDVAASGRLGLTAAAESGSFGRSRRSKAAGLAGSRASTKPVSSGSTFGRSTLQKSVIGVNGPVGVGFQPVFADVEKRMETIGIPAPDPSHRFHREREARLIEKVQNLNNARLQKKCFPVLHEFASTAAEGGEEHSQAIANAYRALVEIVGEDLEAQRPTDPTAIKERSYAKSYLSETPNSKEQMAMKRRILRGSTRHLEKMFFETIETYVAKSPREANLGGIPNVISKVKAFVRLKGLRKDLAPDNNNLQIVGDDYVWALIFYLLRSGQVEDAKNYVESNLSAFSAIDPSFYPYIAAYSNDTDRNLPPNLRNQINNAYTQRLRIAPENSIDPFRMACYKVIGRCDLKNRHFEGLGHGQGVDDFIWLQFVLAREVNQADELASEVYNLAAVQENIKQIGQRYFSKDVNYGMHFYLQVMAGFFEEAVAFIYPHSYIDAVHFAIALDYYGLLRVSDPLVEDSDLLSYTTRGQAQLKFGHMVGYYTRDFRAGNATAAVDYLSLICLNGDLPNPHGVRQITLCHEALRELVLESREFALLLGDIRGDGQRIKGVIEERMKLIGLQERDDFMRTITIQAASVADDNGRTTDAVLLYHLAQEYDNVLTVINRALSEAVCVPIGQEQMRLQPLKPRIAPSSQQDQVQLNSLSLTSVDDPVVLARNMLGLYSQTGMYKESIKESNWKDCEALIRMSEARVCVVDGQWGRALDVSHELKCCHIMRTPTNVIV